MADPRYCTRWGRIAPSDPIQPWNRQLPGWRLITLGFILTFLSVTYHTTWGPSAVERREEHWCDTHLCTEYPQQPQQP